MAYTIPTTRSTGTLITASIWNTDLVENLKYFKNAPSFDGAISATSLTLAGALSGVTSITASGKITTTGGSGDGAGISFVANGLYIQGGSDGVWWNNTANSLNLMQLSNVGELIIFQGSLYVAAGNIKLAATQKFYLDGGGDTCIYESSANALDLVAGGVNVLRATSTGALINNNLNLTIGATAKFYLDGGGDTYFTETSANVVDLFVGGTNYLRVNSAAVFSSGATGIGYYAANAGTNTGTAVVRNADGYLYLTSSSRRFKENMAPAVITDEQLDAFVAVSPSWWDYTGQRNGALGFIAEDVAAVPLERYGVSPLVNYDKDGQVESNRDYALIAMQHLAIQRLTRKVAALEARQ